MAREARLFPVPDDAGGGGDVPASRPGWPQSQSSHETRLDGLITNSEAVVLKDTKAYLREKEAYHSSSSCGGPLLIAPAVLPDGNGGFTPCPEVLTEDEAIRYLRLGEIDVDDSGGTLRYYRKKGLLRATQVGKSIRYRRIELERMLDRLTQDNPR